MNVAKDNPFEIIGSTDLIPSSTTVALFIIEKGKVTCGFKIGPVSFMKNGNVVRKGRAVKVTPNQNIDWLEIQPFCELDWRGKSKSY